MSSAEALDLIRRVAEALTSAGLVVDGEPDCSGELAGKTTEPLQKTSARTTRKNRKPGRTYRIPNRQPA